MLNKVIDSILNKFRKPKANAPWEETITKIIRMYQEAPDRFLSIKDIAPAVCGRVVYIKQAVGEAVFPVIERDDMVVFLPKRCGRQGAMLNKQAWRLIHPECEKPIFTMAITAPIVVWKDAEVVLTEEQVR